MKITKLRITDFLGISTLKVDALGKINSISGGNGVGKSSVLKAIQEGLKSSGADPDLIRSGKKKGEIFLEIDGRVQVERKITGRSGGLKVTVDGEPANKPQAFIDGLLGRHMFNPVGFFAAKKRDRVNQLLEALPVTLDQGWLQEQVDNIGDLIDLDNFRYSDHGLTVLATIRQSVYDKRAEINRDRTRIEKSIEQDRRDMPEAINADEFDGFDLSAEMTRLQEAQSAVTAHDARQKELADLRSQAKAKLQEIADLEAKLADLRASVAEMQERGKTLATEVEQYEDPNVQAIRERIDAYNAQRQYAVQLDAIRKKETEAEQMEANHSDLDDLHEKLVDDVPQALLATADLPIDGLTIDGDQIFIGGVSIDKLSTSEQIKLALEVARSQAGELQIICVDGFEAMDQSSQQEFEAQAATDDFEYFITVVTDGDLQMETTAA